MMPKSFCMKSVEDNVSAGVHSPDPIESWHSGVYKNLSKPSFAASGQRIVVIHAYIGSDDNFNEAMVSAALKTISRQRGESVVIDFHAISALCVRNKFHCGRVEAACGHTGRRSGCRCSHRIIDPWTTPAQLVSWLLSSDIHLILCQVKQQQSRGILNTHTNFIFLFTNRGFT